MSPLSSVDRANWLRLHMRVAIRKGERTYIRNKVLVAGLPCVDSTKHDKLKNVVKKVSRLIGGTICDDIEMPHISIADGFSLGYAILRFSNNTDAHRASQRLNEYRLDKQHTLNAITLSTAVRREQSRLRFIGVLRCVIALLALHRRSAERTYTPPHGIGYQHSMREFYDLVNAQLQ